MDEVSEKYREGFNHGYLIRQHRPKVKLAGQAQSPDDYALGFVDGGKQFELEQQRNKLREKFSRDQTQSKDKDLGRGR